MMILRLLIYYLSLFYWSFCSSEKIRKMQLRKFREIFEYAREHSPFYRAIYTQAGVMDLKIKSWGDVEKIPIIDKALMRKYGFEATLAMDKDGLVQCSTSGSTGEPFKLAYTKYANLTAYLRMYYVMHRVAGYTPFRKMTLLSKYEVNEIFKVEKNVGIIARLQKKCSLFSRQIISVFESPEKIVAKLRDYNPYILYSSSSAVEIVANYLIRNNETLLIPYIVLIAEPVSKEQYEKFTHCMNANVVDVYGAKESPSLGYELNKSGEFTLFPNSNVFEFINRYDSEYGEKGTVVITNLINKAQPFIRYNLQDYADILSDSDFGIKKIGPIVGRLSDVLTLPDGSQLFHYCISQCFIDFHYAMQYKFLQVGSNPIVMQILPSPQYDQNIIREEAIKRWNKKYPMFPLSVEFVDKFDVDGKTGKFKVIEHLRGGR